MVIVTLLEKVYGSFSSKIFQPYLESLLKDLNVTLNIIGSKNGWLQVEIIGEDEKATLRYLEWRIGLAPESLDNVRKFSSFTGRVLIGESKTELYVDVGIFHPRPLNVVVPLQTLQAQLTDGKKFALQRIAELFGLDNFVPLHVRIVSRDDKKGKVYAELSTMQVSRFEDWIRSSVDRLLVLGSLISYVERAVQLSGHMRDIIKIQSLGLLDHVVICKLGTDAKGLIPHFGKYLKTASLIPFSPRRILELLDRYES